MRNTARDFRLNTLIETGAFKGGMIRAVEGAFRAICSIELDPDLYRAARDRFAGYSHVTVIHGDSAAVLKQLLLEVPSPSVFWLDAHYSGDGMVRGEVEAPIMGDLQAIEAHGQRTRDVILIDDAREFGAGDYPSLSLVRSWAREQGCDRFDVENDVVRIYATRKCRTA